MADYQATPPQKRLPRAQAERLDALWAIAQQKATSSLEFGEVLAEIKQSMKRLGVFSYKEWERLCAERVNYFGKPLSASHADRLIRDSQASARQRSAQICAKNPEQVRALAQFDDDEQGEAMEAAQAAADAEGRPMTAGDVRDVRRRRAGESLDDILEDNRQRAAERKKAGTQQRQQTKEEKAVAGVRRKLNRLLVEPGKWIAAAIKQAATLGGVLDLDRAAPRLEAARLLYEQAADEVTAALKILSESAGPARGRAA